MGTNKGKSRLEKRSPDMKRPKIRFSVIMLIMMFLVLAVKGQDAQNTNNFYNTDKSGAIIGGYDVVSYLIDTPTKGKKELTSEYMGIDYWFSSKENQKIFEKDPSKFVPAYGGWCAYAMGDSGQMVKIDPETYKIIDGKLYLFYNFYFNNTLIGWNKDENNLKEKANQNWQKITH